MNISGFNRAWPRVSRPRQKTDTVPPFMLNTIVTDTLEIAYEEQGEPSGIAVVLLHGFPDDPRAWDDVARALARVRPNAIPIC